jgi:uncharacterized protein with HEPN domain
MITGIKLLLLRNSEYLQFSKDFLSIAERNNPAVLKVELQYNKLLQLTGELETLFSKEKGSWITKQVAEQDERRDRALLGITGVANTYAWHFDPGMVKHAANLARRIDLYDNRIDKENYQAETAIIDNLINDLKTKPELVAAMEALHIKDWCDELEAANTAFNDAYLQRTKEKGNKNKTTIVAHRKQMNTAYYELRDLIDSYFTVNKGAEPYNTITDEVNVLIRQYKDIMKEWRNEK